LADFKNYFTVGIRNYFYIKLLLEVTTSPEFYTYTTFVNCNYRQYCEKLLSNKRCCNLSFSYSHVMVYVLNTDNYCYLLSSVVLLDDVSMTSCAFVYSKLKQRLIEVWCRVEQLTVDMAEFAQNTLFGCKNFSARGV